MILENTVTDTIHADIQQTTLTNKANPHPSGGCEWGIWEYKECIVTDFRKCRGSREKIRKQFPSEGGDFSTIIKVSFFLV